MKNNFLTLIAILLFSNPIISQQRNCGTMQHLEYLKSKDSNLEQKMLQNEENIKTWILNNTNRLSQNIITIPVVVHIVYYNNTENISDQQIFSQIDILNEDFRRLNSDTINTPAAFQSVAADTEIEFCLATRDPNGNPTNGITRTSTTQTSFSTNDGVKYSSSGGKDAWNTSKYLNMWVCDLSGGLLGYAQFPGGTASSDGVVCDYAYFGDIGTASSPYDLGRTTTHEVGHWLNLRHIWGDSNCGNDFCNDTPEHSGSNYGCPSYPSTSNCSGNGNAGDMFMNYMDYTDDACMNIFTNDQKNRMIAAINTSRSGLLTSDGCFNSDYGCTDPLAVNFSPIAIIDDGSCCYVSGCTDPTAFNYNPNACYDDSSCVASVLGCTNPTATNYDPIANTTVAYGGATDNSFGTGGYFNGDQHLLFDSYKECIIRSALIYSEASNTITFELRDNGGTVLDDTTLNVIAGQQRIDLNFDVPIGTDLQLGVSAGALQGDGLYRNNASANYPYDIASALSITRSSASGNGGANAYTYYYFYYDLEVEVPCLNSSNSSWDCDGQGNCYDPGTGNGAYSSLSSCQSNCVVPSWDCDGQGNCYDPGTGNGLYGSLTVCQSNCVVPSWDCDGQGNCYDPGTGNGAYSSLSSCQSNCVVPVTWDCDGQGNCYDPGNGNGAYSSLSSCQSNCVVPSWDCDGQGNCYDPGNGNGAYSSLSSCQSNCVVPSWDCDDQGNCYDPGTGNGLYNTLSACQLECVKTSIFDANTLDFKVYPNPSNNIFNIELNTISQESIKIKIMNTIGDIIYSNELVNYKGEYNSKIDLTQQAKGIYLLDIMTNQEIIKVKLILQ